MTDSSDPARQLPLTRADVVEGEDDSEPHDPGPPEQHAGEPVPDPWEEAPDGQLDSGAVPGGTPH